MGLMLDKKNGNHYHVKHAKHYMNREGSKLCIDSDFIKFHPNNARHKIVLILCINILTRCIKNHGFNQSRSRCVYFLLMSSYGTYNCVIPPVCGKSHNLSYTPGKT